MIATHPALRLLAKRKFLGALRKQLRRVKTVKGALFAGTGLLVFAVWIVSILLPQFAADASRGRGYDLVLTTDVAQVGIFAMALFAVLGSLGHRGLFLPKEEIELLFSAPVSRKDVIRYRLLTNVGRSIFGACIVGLFALRRAPDPLYAFVGTFLAVQTLPLLSQGASLVLGGAENRARSSLPRRVAQTAGLVGVFVYVGILILLSTNAAVDVTKWMESTDAGRLVDEVLRHPVLWWASSPFRPWASMITATKATAFFPWFAASAAAWMLLFEIVSRIPVDYRELSLQTSSDVAKRIQRMRRAGGASMGDVSKRAAGWKVPRLFGRGRFGAIAWLKTASIVRKARGAVVVSLIIVALLTIGASVLGLSRSGAEAEPMISIGVVFVGCLYLCSGLRFDFREDLDRMEFIKTCPLRPWVIFLANVTPQVVLVSVLIATALLVKNWIAGRFHPANWVLLPCIPLLTLTWVSIDNVVFLAAPVRYVPGQDTVLQNAGRTVVLMFLRLGIVLAVGLTIAVPVGLAAGAAAAFPTFSPLFLTVGGVLGFVVWAVDASILVAAGAWQIRRFDVARDRP